MVSPAHRDNHASSNDILRCAARRSQQGRAKAAVRREEADDSANHRSSNISVPDHLEKVNKIWRAVALVIDNSLLSVSRGVRIESFGTFTVDAKGRPRFFLSPEFAARHRLLKYDVCAGGCLAGGAVNARLNVAKVAATAGSLRPDAECVVDAVLRSVRQCLAAGKYATLSFHPVAEFCCAPGAEAVMRYLPGFKARQKAAGAAATRAQIGTGRANSKPTPWAAIATASIPSAAASSAAAAAAAATPTATGGGSVTFTTVPCQRVVDLVASPTAVEHLKASPVVAAQQHPGAGGLVETALQRPHSAFSSKPKVKHVVTNRPRPTRGESIRSARGRALSATAVPAGRRHAWGDEPRGTRTSGDNENRSLETKSPSRHPSPRTPSVRTPRSSHGGRRSEVVHTGENIVGRFVAEDTACQAHETHLSSGGSNSGHRYQTRKERHEKWLANLLRGRTLEQEGGEGLRRLVVTLKVMYVVGDNDDGESSNTAGGRLSGKDLLQALRDVGTRLTPEELAEVVYIFRRQPDGRVCLRRLFVELEEGELRPKLSGERIAALTPSPIGAPVARSDSCGGTSEPPRPRSPCRRGAVRVELSQQILSMHPGGGGALGSSCSGSFPAHEEALMTGSSCWSNITESRGGAGEGTRVPGWSDGGGRQRAVAWYHHEGFDASNTLAAARAKTRPHSESVLWQHRRRCWGDGVGGGKVTAAAVAAVDGDAMADLANIVYNPPCSLEGLIQVLQASKVTEQPTIACATLSARLIQLCPRLGKARAKEVAAAACHYPDTQIDLERLYCTLQRRFGHCNGGYSCAAGTVARSDVSATETTSSANFSTSLGGLSCAAVHRVRRNLFAGKGGLSRLKHVFAEEAGRLGDGSLTKGELRRALMIAGGRGSHPSTTKDVDDLFTLFSCRTKAGVGGGRVDAATVLRGLRGELSPSREAVVRDVFSSLLRLGGGRISGRGEGQNRGAANGERRGAVTVGQAGGAIPLEELRDACNASGPNVGLLTTRRSTRGVSGCDGGSIAVLQGRGSGGSGADVGHGGQLLDDGSEQMGAIGRRKTAAGKGVTVEQFLEYYTDVSAGIDGDDAFETIVRGSWFLDASASAKCCASTISTAPDEQGDQNFRRSTSQPPRSPLDNAHAEMMSRNSEAREVGISAAAEASGQAWTMGEAEEGDGVGVRQPDRCRRHSGFNTSRLQQQQHQHQQQQRQRQRYKQMPSSVSPFVTPSPRGDKKDDDNNNNNNGIVAKSAESAVGGKHQEQERAEASSNRTPTTTPDGSPASGENRPKNTSARVRAVTSSASPAGTVGDSHRHVRRCDQRRDRPTTTNNHNNNSSSRSAAAIRVQRVFRGHRGRQGAAVEDRKRARQRATEREAQAEWERRSTSRRLAQRLPRPKVPGTYGF